MKLDFNYSILRNKLAVCIVLILCFYNHARSQGPIIVNTQATRPIENVERREQSPKIIDTVFPSPTANYPMLQVNYEPTVSINPITPATIAINPKLPQLYRGYARVGIGTLLMPLAEFYFNNARTRKLNYGAHLNHLSSFGAMKNLAPAQFDRTSASVFVGKNERKYKWIGESFYKLQGLHYYGFNNPSANKDSIAQRFNTFGLKGLFTNHQHDSLGINWNAGLEYRYFTDKQPKVDSLKEWKSSENYFTACGGAWMRWGNEILSADAQFKFNGYSHGVLGDTLAFAQDSGIFNKSFVLNLQPAITTYSKNRRLKAKFGIDLTFSGGTQSRVNLYPNMEAKYSLFDDILIPYVHLKGGLTQQTYKNSVDENEFILSNIQLKNEHKAIEAMFGLKGTLSKRVGFNVSGSFANLKDKALFVNDTLFSNRNQFRIIYDTMNVAKIEASVNYQFMEKMKIDLIGRFFSYSAVNNSYAWNLPQLQFVIRGVYNLYDKFIFNLDLNIEQGRKALVFESGKDIILENNQFVKNLGFIADVNLGLEYRYNTRISAFMNFNNLAAQRYSRWQNYPVQGFQVMGGITFRF
jgi:hypothetical protein